MPWAHGIAGSNPVAPINIYRAVSSVWEFNCPLYFMSTEFDAQLTGPNTIRLGQPLRFIFSIKNINTYDWYILPWFTPLEGLLSNCLNVTKDGLSLEYSGILMKRRQPSILNYCLVKVGESIEKEFELNLSYSIRSPGSYLIDLKTQTIDCIQTAFDGLALVNKKKLSIPKCQHAFQVIAS